MHTAHKDFDRDAAPGDLLREVAPEVLCARRASALNTENRDRHARPPVAWRQTMHSLGGIGVQISAKIDLNIGAAPALGRTARPVTLGTGRDSSKWPDSRIAPRSSAQMRHELEGAGVLGSYRALEKG